VVTEINFELNVKSATRAIRKDLLSRPFRKLAWVFQEQVLARTAPHAARICPTSATAFCVPSIHSKPESVGANRNGKLCKLCGTSGLRGA
jgi:hypothetical protein